MADAHLFDVRNAKTETLTLRCTKEQKERINFMAINNGMNLSKYIFTLVQREHHRIVNKEASLNDFFDNVDDGLPF